MQSPPQPATEAEVTALRGELATQRELLMHALDDSRQQITTLREELARQQSASSQSMKKLEQRFDETHDNEKLMVRAGGLTLRFTGFVQVDAVAWQQSSVNEVDPSTGNPLNQTRFLLRRGRLRMELDYRFVFMDLELDANTINGAQVRPMYSDVGVRYKNPKDSNVPFIAAHMGIVRTPFGFEVQQRDPDRLFLERSTVMDAFFPGQYDLGARVFGGWRFLRYVVGAMNGDPVGEKLFPYRDPTRSMDFVFRGGVDFVLKRIGIRGGFSAVSGQGFHPGTPAGKDTLVWRDQNQNGTIDPSEIVSIPGQAALPSQTFKRYALGGDLGVSTILPRVGTLTLMAELVYGVNMDRSLVPADPIGSARDLRELGWYVGATQELTKWAMVGLRYDAYNPDRDSTQTTVGRVVPRNQTYTTIAATAAARLPPWGRLIFEYDHQTNPLGRTTAGVPTTLANDQFVVRGEVTF